MKPRHHIRIAHASDGPAIGRLITDAGWSIDGLDWSNVAPFWLVASDAGKIVGCIQVALSRPIGYLEMLAVDTGITDGFKRQALVQDLLTQGLAVHHRNGCQMVAGVVPFAMKGFKKVLKKRGCRVVAYGNVMVKRLGTAP